MDGVNNLNVKFLSSVSYVGPLFVMAKFSVEKDINQVRFHTKQGEILFWLGLVSVLFTYILELTATHFLEITSVIFLLIYIGIGVAWFILALMGIFSAVKGEKIGLPLVDDIAKKLNKKEGKS